MRNKTPRIKPEGNDEKANHIIEIEGDRIDK